MASFGLCGYKSRVAFDPLVLAFLLGSPLLGCSAQQGVCGEHEEPALHADGGAVGCVKAESCPLPSGALYCVTPLFDEMKPCVDCRDSACVVRVPEACR